MVRKTDSLALRGRLLLDGRIVEDGALLAEKGIITYSGPASAAPKADFEQTEGILVPGFVDIHCHAAQQVFAHEDARFVADYHLCHGTTAMLLTLYRDLEHLRMLAAVEDIKGQMARIGNVLGVHLEGPYLNPRYGTGHGGTVSVVPVEYEELADTGIIRQWTCAPEVPGVPEFIRYIRERGIVPAIGHSEASPEQVRQAEKAGARIVTHLFDATGCSYAATRWAGTLETDLSTAALACDEYYYEIICDRGGVHVRPEFVKLAVKAAGIDRIVGITDCYVGPEDGSDVNFDGTDLSGSKLTMDQVARNFLALGLSLPQVFQVVAENPAKAIGVDHLVGSLKEGRRADVLVIDENINLKRIYKSRN